MKTVLSPIVAYLITGQFAAAPTLANPPPPFVPFDIQPFEPGEELSDE